MFANLVANGARSFASGLAGSRAFAAAAGAQGLFQHSFINSSKLSTCLSFYCLKGSLTASLAVLLALVEPASSYAIPIRSTMSKSESFIHPYLSIAALGHTGFCAVNCFCYRHYFAFQIYPPIFNGYDS